MMNELGKRIFVFFIAQTLAIMPALALDLESTVTDNVRQNYSNTGSSSKQTPKTTTTNSTVQTQINNNTPSANQQTTEQAVIKQDLPTVPNPPKQINGKNIAPVNTLYSGKMPNGEALIPCTNIKQSPLTIDSRVVKSKEKTQKQTTKTVYNKTQQKQNYRYFRLAKGTQIRVINQNKITDYLTEGQGVVFLSLHEVKTPYMTIPKNTKFTARVEDAHRPQITCNGGLVGLKLVSAQINGYNQTLDGGVIRLKTDKVYFSNLKGEHTYKKNLVKKAKWGQNKFKAYSKTSHELANKGAGVIIAPFPYIGGCVLAAASTVSSPVTALLGKGGSLNIPAKTTFTIKLYEDAKIRY